MSLNNDKIKGKFNSSVGSVKEKAGQATGNRNLEAEGNIQKTKGQAQSLSGAVKDTIKKARNLFGLGEKK
jgi:uncharacterized protein YjbJ (UPF0337 family)